MGALSKTKQAIDEYDAFAIYYESCPSGRLDEATEILEYLAEQVGVAYGEETKAFNNPEDCRRLIRPGHKVPPPGYELSFVRKMVVSWEK